MRKSLQKLREKRYEYKKLQVEISMNNTHEYKLVRKKDRSFVQWLDSYCARELVHNLDERRRKGETTFSVDYR